MFKFVILLSAVACALGGIISKCLLPELDSRIVGGYATDIEEFPWQASLQEGGDHFCGGSIIKEDRILTAAHCVQGASPSDLEIRVGATCRSSGGTLVSVESFVIHEGFNSSTLVNDVAVIYLSSPLILSDKIKVIGLASTTPADGAPAKVSGWGTTLSGSPALPEQLRYVDVEIISQYRCASNEFLYGSEIEDTMICAGTIGKDSCQGDSGGPLVSSGFLVGIVSWGYGCGLPKYPGVYTNIAKVVSWISAHL